MKEKSEGARAQPRGVFDYQASKRPTFTDSFPLCGAFYSPFIRAEGFLDAFRC